MIFNLLLPLLVSSAVLAATSDATFVARNCNTHKGHAANTINEQCGCSGDTPSALNARIFRTIGGPYTTPEPTTYAMHGGIERRLHRTIRPIEERATPGIEKPAPTRTDIAIPTPYTKTKINTRTKTTRTFAPVEERSFLPIEDVPTYTIKQKPTTKIRIRETSVGVPIERRLIRPGDDKPIATPAPTTYTKPKTRTGTTHMIVRVEERSFQPIEDVPTFTINPKPTKTKTKTKAGTPMLVPIEEDTA